MNILGKWLASVLNKCPEGQDETEINLEYISKGNKSLEIRMKGVFIGFKSIPSGLLHSIYLLIL